MNREKAKKKYWNYETRKDRRFDDLELYYAESEVMGRGRHKKSLKKAASKKVRLSDEEFSDGCNYKKKFDIPWNLA